MARLLMTDPESSSNEHAESAEDSSGKESEDASSTEGSATETFKAIQRNLSELVSYAGQYAGAKVGSLSFTLRKIAYLALLAIVALIVALSMLVTASVLVIVGLAQAVSAAMPAGFEWVGPLGVGGAAVV
ncbi:MAG: hypothetical protein AAGK78_04900, partial [Planctomycetota bacterium]